MGFFLVFAGAGERQEASVKEFFGARPPPVREYGLEGGEDAIDDNLCRSPGGIERVEPDGVVLGGIKDHDAASRIFGGVVDDVVDELALRIDHHHRAASLDIG